MAAARKRELPAEVVGPRAVLLLCVLALNRPRPRLSNSPLPRTHLIDPPD